jgi:hypothetical protein
VFEEVQRRNRRPIWPFLALAGICVVLYFGVDRCMRERSDRDVDEVFSAYHSQAPLGLNEYAKLEPVELPGMQIELPGQPDQRTGDYVQGTVQVGQTAAVGWTAGKLITDRKFIRDSFEKNFRMGKQAPVPTTLGGAQAFEDYDAEMHVVIGECGRRTVFVQALASHERWMEIKKSFRCTPTRPLDHLGVIVGPSKTWHRDTDDPKLHLSDGKGAQMTMQSRKDSYDPRGKLGIPRDAKPEVRGGYRVWRGSGTSLDGKPMVIALVDWQCTDQPYFGEALVTSTGAIDEGIEVALTGSCIAMDAPLPAHLVQR